MTITLREILAEYEDDAQAAAVLEYVFQAREGRITAEKLTKKLEDALKMEFDYDSDNHS